MYKKIILCTLGAIAFFGAGYLTNQKVKTVSDDYLIEDSLFKKNLISKQQNALILANELMDKHNLLDKDGSDEMFDYLELCCSIDSLFYSQL